ncbi:MAG TPA: aminotransferase class III-fold pyridoxal phosphate-dependent enzyme, partial [Candidatus Hydrogenedentes bacterium]|nr:aminotransferase class III-fold pyridoxal phosphate-dependent enzyme [Candidatus Hydrogenedentota bacterium]
HYTHEKSPVACAAALATIEVLIEDGVIENANRMGAYALERLREMGARHPIIGDVRGLGLLIGVELLRPDGARAIDEAEQVMYGALSRGLNFKVTMGNILTLTPPLIITREQMDEAFRILDASIAAVGS